MKKQIPWLRVFVEGVAIVSSILLAFAIDAWWAGQQDQQEEFRALDVLVRDLAEAVDQLTEFRAHTDDIADANAGAYVALSGDHRDLDRAEVSDQLIRSLFRRTMRLPRTAYTDLISTGDIRLIRNRDLRDKIIQFYEFAERSEEIIEKNSTRYTDGNLGAVLIRDGLVLPRPEETELNPLQIERNQLFRERLGAEFEHRPDPLWSLSPESKEWDRIRSALLQNGVGAQFNIVLVDRLLSDADSLKMTIQSYIEENAP